MRWNLLPFIIPLFLAGCANHQEVATLSPTVWFTCESGQAFMAERIGDGMVVDTGNGRYELAPRRSSIGEKYASEDTTLIIDEESAVLIGAPGNSYTNCRRVYDGMAGTEPQGI